MLVDYVGLQAPIPAPGALQHHPKCHGKGQEPCSFPASALLLPCLCLATVQFLPGLPLHPPQQKRCCTLTPLQHAWGAWGSPGSTPPPPAPPCSPCPSAAAETRQAGCPACSALCLSPGPCLAQTCGHPVPWQCGLAESWCNSSAPSEGKNLPRSALQPPSSSSARSWSQ